MGISAVIQLVSYGTGNLRRDVRDVVDVQCSLSTVLPGANVHDRRTQIASFPYSGRAIADKTPGAPQHGQETGCGGMA